MLTKKYNSWINTLFPHDEHKVFIWLGPGGLGDKISCLPAFRHLKRMYPDKKVVLFTESLSADVWKACRYIDYIIPEDCVKGPDALYIRNIKDGPDLAIKAWWSFFEHHQKHICKSNIEHVCNTTYTEDIPLEYEMSIFDYDEFPISKLKEEILDKAKYKQIVGISPAYTMYSRMWSVESWQKLTQLLIKAGYFVVVFGGNNDLDIQWIYDKDVRTSLIGYNCLDLRDKIPIRWLPRVLDIFDNIITLNSGMLHLASVNQDVPITYLNVGQFPSELIVPYRRGTLFHKVKVIEHDCPLKRECFEGHITETRIRPMMFDFLNTYKKENGEEFPNEKIELMKKYVCWHYCAKLVDKYSCSRLITPEMVVKSLEENPWMKKEN